MVFRPSRGLDDGAYNRYRCGATVEMGSIPFPWTIYGLEFTRVLVELWSQATFQPKYLHFKHAFALIRVTFCVTDGGATTARTLRGSRVVTGLYICGRKGNVDPFLLDHHHSRRCIMEDFVYRQYAGESDLPHIMALVQSELSEPYVIYTFRYFLHQWCVSSGRVIGLCSSCAAVCVGRISLSWYVSSMCAFGHFSTFH